MARDRRRLRVFNEAHQLVLAIYQETRAFRATNGLESVPRFGGRPYPSPATWLKEVRGAEPVSTFISLMCHADLQRKSRI